MRILFLVSDPKWTGPAEPALVAMRALRARGHGIELVCPSPLPASAKLATPAVNRSLFSEATARGLAPRATIVPGRSAWRAGDGERVVTLRRWLASEEVGGPFDVIHCWHSRDHVLAARALGRAPFDRTGVARAGADRVDRASRAGGERGGAATRIVRSYPRAEPIEAWFWNRWLFGRACDGLICPSEASASAARRVRPRGALAGMLGAVDAADGYESAAPSHERAGAAARARLGIAPDAFVIGVVARMQAHRRFDLLLAAMAKLAPRVPEARLLLLGRGTRAEAVVGAPVRALGLEEKVVRAGHRTEDYAACLAAMDVFTFLVPGSDGSCRALLEAAAAGRALVGTRRGAIPEILRAGETGLLVDESPDALVEAWEALARDPARRLALGAAARRDAAIRFAPARLAERLEAFYDEVVRSAPTSSR